MKVLEVKDLTKVFSGKKGKKFTAVDHVSFFLEKGEILGFLGPNGAGKTSTIQMLLGVLTPSFGKISYFGEDFWRRDEKASLDKWGKFEKLGQSKEVLKRVGFASAYSDLPHRMTVWENLSFYSEIYEVDNKKERIRNLLGEFGALSLIDKQMNSLSAGQKTRVLLAKAFLNKPEIVLLDEPTASLDIEIADLIRKFILKKQKEDGISVLLTSHNMKDVEELADRVLVINHGKIVDDGTPLQLIQKMNMTRVKFVVFDNKEEAKTVLFEFKKKGEIQDDWEGVRCEIKIKDELIPKFLAKMFERSVFIRDLEIERPGLEDYFLDNAKLKSQNGK